jgi:hypothetical protein
MLRTSFIKIYDYTYVNKCRDQCFMIYIKRETILLSLKNIYDQTEREKNIIQRFIYFLHKQTKIFYSTLILFSIQFNKLSTLLNNKDQRIIVNVIL